MQLQLMGIKGATSINLINTATRKLTGAELEAALATTGLKQAELEKLLVERGMSAETAKNTAATIAQSAANTTATATTTGLSASVGGLGVAFKGLTAAIASNPIGFIITAGIVAITGIIRCISWLNEQKEELAQKVDEVTSKFEEQKKTIENTRNTLDGISEKYKLLSKGVGGLNENISLSSNEYNEYLDICNQIADMFPELVQGYDSQGNAILTVKGNVEKLNQAYKDMIITANNNVLNNSSEIFGDFNNKSIDYGETLDLWKEIWSNEKDMELSTIRDIERALKSSNIEQYVNDVFKTGLPNLVQLRQALIDKGIEQKSGETGQEFITRAFKENKNVIQAIVDNYNTQVDDAASKMKSLASAYISNALLTSNDYKNITDDTKSLINNIINDYTFEDFDDFDSVDDFYNHLRGILSQFNKLSESNQDEIKLAFSAETEFNNNKISVSEYEKRISNIKDAMIGLDDDIQSKITLMLDDSDLQNKINTIKDKGKKDSNYIAWVDNLKSSDIEKLYQLAIKKGSSKNDIIKYKSALDDYNSAIKNAIANNQSVFDNKSINDAYESLMRYGIAIETIDIKTETENIDKFNTAVKESVSATGLSADSIEVLTSRYQDLESFNPSALFEKTTGGVHLNQDALQDLENQFEQTQKALINNKLDGLIAEYNSLQVQIDNCRDASKLAQLQSDRDTKYQEIQDTQTLAAQYEALTSAYNKWQRAKSGDNEYDKYANIGNAYNDIKDLIEQGWVDDTEIKEYLDLLLDADKRTQDNTKDFQKLTDKIKGTNFSIMDFFQYDDNNKLTSEGLFNFLDAVKQKFGKLSDEYVQIDENGVYSFDFTGKKVEEVAKALGMTTEAVQIFEQALSGAGFHVMFSDIDTMIKSSREHAQDAIDKLKELKENNKIETKVDFDNFDVDSTDIQDLNSQIKSAGKLLDSFKKKDGTVNIKLNGAKEAQELLLTLINNKQNLSAPLVMNVDTEQLNKSDKKLAKGVEHLQNFVKYSNDLEIQTSLGLDTTETQKKLKGEIKALNKLDPKVKTKLKLDKDSVTTAFKNISGTKIKAGVELNQDDIDTVNTAINSIKSKNLKIKSNSKAITKDLKEIKDYKIGDKSFKVSISGATNVISQLSQINTLLDTLSNGSITITTDSKTKNNKSKGKAKAKGSAYSTGNWGTKDSGVGLFGELGREILVDSESGTWKTVGDNGAEFVKYNKGSIVFNHKQTEQLLGTGKTGRGKSFASGTAFANGGFGGGGIRNNITTHSVNKNNDYKSNSNKSNSKSKTSTSKTSDKTAKDTKETFDWIEISIDRIESKISQLDKNASNSYKKWSARNKSLIKQMSKVKSEINLQSKAYDRYIKQAKSVKLSGSWVDKVRKGKIDISTIKDDKLAEKIKNFQTWYEKAKACKDTIKELNITLSELQKQKFDNIASQYDENISRIEHNKTMLEQSISRVEEKGRIVSAKYYNALISNQTSINKKLIEKRTKLYSSLNDAVASGKIKKGSEEWNDMISQINSVTQEIDAGKNSIIEYQNEIRKTKEAIFDIKMARIGNLTDEADFLINLMKDSKLYDDKGQLTDNGSATMGLHIQNYKTYSKEAKLYADEINKLNDEIKKDPYNQKLIDRRDELISKQRESILAANSEKMAIRDLVENGIKLELDSLKELIGKYEESLDSQKDLYEYSKKTKEQTKEIASIQKQLMAYAGDTSEETMSKVQKLQVSLEDAQNELAESQYDRYISGQKKVLDDLYSEYEDVLNKRLDDIDSLITDMTSAVNQNAETISSTIKTAALFVGYTISPKLSSIWETATQSNIGTGVNGAISSIVFNVKNMIEALNKAAGKDISADNSSNATNSKASKGKKKTNKKKKNIKKHATGVFNISKDELAWTQESGIPEMIIRPSDGAILTPLTKGDSVLNGSATSNIWNMANDPSKFILDNLFDDKLPNGVTNVSSVDNSSASYNFENINFNLPNVKNYEELFYAMQHDKKFEQLVRAMTTDRLFGKSALNKFKIK